MKPGTSKRGPKRRGTKKGGPTKIGTTKRRRIHKTGRRRSMHKKMRGGVNDENTKTMLLNNILSTVMLFVKVEADHTKRVQIRNNVLMRLNTVCADVKKYDFTPPLVTDREQFNTLDNSEKTKIWVALFWKSFRDSEQLYKETIKHIVVPSNINNIKIFENNPNSRSWTRKGGTFVSGPITLTQNSTWSSAAHTNINIDKLIELFLNIYKNVDTYVITDDFKGLDLSPYDTEMQDNGVEGVEDSGRSKLVERPVSTKDLFPLPPTKLKPIHYAPRLTSAPAYGHVGEDGADHIPQPLELHTKEDDEIESESEDEIESESESEDENDEHDGNGAGVKKSEPLGQSEGNSTYVSRPGVKVTIYKNPNSNRKLKVTVDSNRNTKADANRKSYNNWGVYEYYKKGSRRYYWYKKHNDIEVSEWVVPPNDDEKGWRFYYYGTFDKGNHWYNINTREKKYISPPIEKPGMFT